MFLLHDTIKQFTSYHGLLRAEQVQLRTNNKRDIQRELKKQGVTEWLMRIKMN